MARQQPTLAEVALRQQVKAANREAFRDWWEGKLPKVTYWVLGLCAACAVLGVVAWKFLA